MNRGRRKRIRGDAECDPSLRILYLQLLEKTQNSASATPATSSERVYNLIGRVGLSYKFGWGGY
jgi:hypothetical protein